MMFSVFYVFVGNADLRSLRNKDWLREKETKSCEKIIFL